MRVRPPEEGTVPDGSALCVTGVVERAETAEDGLTVTLRPLEICRGPDSRSPQKLPLPEGTILFDTGPEDLRPGQTVTVTGLCRAFPGATNPGQFDSSLYHHILGHAYCLRDARIGARSDTYSHFRDRLCRIRSRLLLSADQCFSPSEAALVRAMLFGDRSSLDEETDLFYSAGLSWLLNTSSLQISLLGGCVFRLLRTKAGRPAAAAAAFLTVLAYGTLCADPKRLLRAILLFGLRMLAEILHRTYDLPTAAAAAGILLLWQQPLYLYHSGFVMAFTAILAAGILVPAAGAEKRQTAARAVLVPLAMLPMQFRFFYKLTVWQSLLRVLAVPVCAAVMVCGAAAVSLELASACVSAWCSPVSGLLLFAARVAGVPASLLLRGLRLLAGLLTGLPGCVFVTGRPSMLRIAVYLAVLSGSVLLKKKRPAFLCRALLLPALLGLFLRPGVRGMEVYFLDVGQGDGILVRTQETVILIDGGSAGDPEIGTRVLEPCLQSLGIRRIDMAVATHTDADHINGLEELLAPAAPDGIRISCLVLPAVGAEMRDSAYHRLERKAGAEGAELIYISRGDRIESEGMQITCLHPEPGGSYGGANEGSLTLLLEYGGDSFLFTGDLEGDGESACLEWCRRDPVLRGKLGKLTCLKAAHHGSRGATSDDWLATVWADWAVISCGRNNIYGHPAQETLSRLREKGICTLSTSEAGCVVFRIGNGDPEVLTMPP